MKRVALDIRRQSFHGWPNSWRISNGLVTVVVVVDVGPRILHAGLVEGPNLLRVFEDTAGRSGGECWTMYGGHRFWIAPEDRRRTYVPDNIPVDVELIRGGLRLTQQPEPGTGLRKQMEIRLEAFQARVRVTHRLINTGVAAVKAAPWALTVMERGGLAVAPLVSARDPERLLPNRSLVFWPYTDLRDPRLHLGHELVLVRQQPGRPPLKIGLPNPEGWLAYWLDEYLFIKRFGYVSGACYPDLQSSSEIYTNSEMLELESLGPLASLPPGGESVHEELWELHRSPPLGVSEEEVRGALEPILMDFGVCKSN